MEMYLDKSDKFEHLNQSVRFWSTEPMDFGTFPSKANLELVHDGF